MNIGIIGAGHVGVVTGACLGSMGHHVFLMDERLSRVQELSRTEVSFYEPGLVELLRKGVAERRVSATADLSSVVRHADVLFITVGTPMVGGKMDVSHVADAARQIGRCLRGTDQYRLVVVRSTVLPGTTEGVVRPLVEAESGRRAGDSFGLSVNPEFLREGSAVADFLHADRVVIGQLDERSGSVLRSVYEAVDCPKIVTTPRNAELLKCVSNALLATLISFSNEIAGICEADSGVDVDEVLSNLWLDRRFRLDGSPEPASIVEYIKAGSGFGGSCLPKDLNSLRAYARGIGVEPALLDAVEVVNTERPARLLPLLEQAIGPLADTVVAVFGLAFKPGTDDVRDSPALAVIDRLLGAGARVKAYDPVVTSLPAVPRGPFELCSSAEEALDDVDGAIIVTPWPQFIGLDWAQLTRRMRRKVILDGRNAMGAVRWVEDVQYVPIGRRVMDKTGSMLEAKPGQRSSRP
jgi:UDPglucose 6-dehydrogenase